MEKPNLWSSMAFVRNVALAAVRKGADLDEICRAVGVTKEILEQPGAAANLDQCIKIWEHAIRHTGDTLLGLHLGETTSPGLAGMVGYLMESSPDLLTAFHNAEQFNRALTNMTTYSVSIRGDMFVYTIDITPAWHDRSPETARQIVEHSASAFVHFVKLLSGKALHPLHVHMRYPRPADTREYLRILKCEPLFGQDSNQIIFRLRDMQLPTIGHNPALNRHFRELLEQEIAKTNQQETFSSEVRRVILQNFNTTLPQLNDVVHHLHITPRTLQRKLKEEGVSFQLITDSVKKELATGLLKKRTLTINEISYKLGYAEPSVFRRAFKKWTGVNPKVYVS
jgi:AraC-like DNA-binding protein